MNNDDDFIDISEAALRIIGSQKIAIQKLVESIKEMREKSPTTAHHVSHKSLLKKIKALEEALDQKQFYSPISYEVLCTGERILEDSGLKKICDEFPTTKFRVVVLDPLPEDLSR